MLFITVPYFLFLLIVVVLYRLIPPGRILHRSVFLIFANLFYYSWWDWRFTFLLLGISAVTFFSGNIIHRMEDGKQKKTALIVSLVLIFSSLIFFKYYNFFAASFVRSLGMFNIGMDLSNLHLILPLGISFYTFQMAGYVLDVYWEKSEPEKNPLIFLAFSSFFPVILAGPVERSTNLLRQLRIRQPMNWEDISSGLTMILWGFFAKMVVSDNLAVYVNTVFSVPGDFNSLTLLFAAFLFMIQLYTDFLGYSSIAIGSAKLLGFDLIKNFNLPFFAPSFSEFWRRWHISLTTWLFDFIFNPLNFTLRRYKKFGIVISLMVTFLISGIWHGAAWTFIVWGLLHGLMLSGEVLFDLKKNVWSRMNHPLIRQSHRFLSILFVFLFVSLIAVFFKASYLSTAMEYIRGIFTFTPGGLFQGISSWNFFLNLFFILVFFMIEYLQYRKIVSLNFSNSLLPLWVRWPAYAFMIFSIFLYGKTQSAFIYFQF